MPVATATQAPGLSEIFPKLPWCEPPLNLSAEEGQVGLEIRDGRLVVKEIDQLLPDNIVDGLR